MAHISNKMLKLSEIIIELPMPELLDEFHNNHDRL